MSPPNMDNPLDTQNTIKAFVLTEFLSGENPEELTNTTPLISTGILDSIATLRLVAFLEQTFGIEMAAHETDAEHLDTIERIARLVHSKKRSPAN
jgi:acyl carrier protein